MKSQLPATKLLVVATFLLGSGLGQTAVAAEQRISLTSQSLIGNAAALRTYGFEGEGRFNDHVFLQFGVNYLDDKDDGAKYLHANRVQEVSVSAANRARVAFGARYYLSPTGDGFYTGANVNSSYWNITYKDDQTRELNREGIVESGASFDTGYLWTVTESLQIRGGAELGFAKTNDRKIHKSATTSRALINEIDSLSINSNRSALYIGFGLAY